MYQLSSISKRTFTFLALGCCRITDNDPQFNCETFANSKRKWEIIHLTSSPTHALKGRAKRAKSKESQIIKTNGDKCFSGIGSHKQKKQNYTKLALFMLLLVLPSIGDITYLFFFLFFFFTNN